MQSQNLSSLPISEDQATAAILAKGCADGVPSLTLRYWSSHGSRAMPVFITWLPGAGRFCLTVKYGRYLLKGTEWQMETGAGLHSAPSPLEQAQVEALRISQVLQLRLGRSVPVSPALVLPDMARDRRMERLARGSSIPLLWNLERYTAALAGAKTDARFRQPLERPLALEEISALMEDSAHASVGPSRAGGRRSQSTSGS